jgi:hypothetical protein
MVFGLVFGLGAVTWAFSGMLSMDPLPYRAGPGSGERTAGPDFSQALRGGLQFEAFQARHPRDVLRQLANLNVKELELTAIAGEPAYFATLAGGDTRIVFLSEPLSGPPVAALGHDRVIDIVTRAAGSGGLAEIRVLDRYDRYYLDRRGNRPLPVILARLNDRDGSRYYIDPKSARVAGTYSARNWVSRWLYHGLHSLDFPWLYNYRPAWDIVVIVFMVGGTSLCVTALILSWRVLGRTLKRLVEAGDSQRLSVDSDDLVPGAD